MIDDFAMYYGYLCMVASCLFVFVAATGFLRGMIVSWMEWAAHIGCWIAAGKPKYGELLEFRRWKRGGGQ